jgi:ethanolamine utilization protein EutA (predicted chaperonin)
VIKAEYLRGVLNGLHDAGMDLEILDLQVVSNGKYIDKGDPVDVTGMVQVSVNEDGLGGSLAIGIE